MNVNDVVRGNIINIQKTHFIVELEDGWSGMVHISNISDYYVASIKSMFQIGHEDNFLVLEVENDTKKVKLSWKAIHPRFLKNPFKYKIEETEGGFERLLENTNKEIEND